MTPEFVSPFIAGLSALIKCEGYSSLEALYEAETQIVLRDLSNAKDDRELTIIQGRYKMLRHLRGLPESTVDKFLASKENQK